MMRKDTFSVGQIFGGARGRQEILNGVRFRTVVWVGRKFRSNGSPERQVRAIKKRRITRAWLGASPGEFLHFAQIQQLRSSPRQDSPARNNANARVIFASMPRLLPVCFRVHPRRWGG
jgi:hypothetical protein